MSSSDVNLVVNHYKQQAEKHGASPRSTMEDDVIRQKEIGLISDFVSAVGSKSSNGLRILDLGCGNGYTLIVMVNQLPGNQFWGLDYSEDLLQIATERNLPNCILSQGDARSMPYETGFFDVVYTERCLINILEWDYQQEALSEIARIIRPGGYYLMIECFTDGLENNNRARQEVGLEPVKEAFHNKYFEKEIFFPFVSQLFDVVEPSALSPRGSELFPYNFLSSHYFVARVLHPLTTKAEWVRNTEFVKFFSFLPPSGNYSPLQAYVLRKKGS